MQKYALYFIFHAAAFCTLFAHKFPWKNNKKNVKWIIKVIQRIAQNVVVVVVEGENGNYDKTEVE